jgi:putative glutathione S-transferase
MGILIDGVWKDEWYDTKSTGGRFVRWESHYRNWITPDGRAGPSGEAALLPNPGVTISTSLLLVRGRTAH